MYERRFVTTEFSPFFSVSDRTGTGNVISPEDSAIQQITERYAGIKNSDLQEYMVRMETGEPIPDLFSSTVGKASRMACVFFLNDYEATHADTPAEAIRRISKVVSTRSDKGIPGRLIDDRVFDFIILRNSYNNRPPYGVDADGYRLVHAFYWALGEAFDVHEHEQKSNQLLWKDAMTILHDALTDHPLGEKFHEPLSEGSRPATVQPGSKESNTAFAAKPLVSKPVGRRPIVYEQNDDGEIVLNHIIPPLSEADATALRGLTVEGITSIVRVLKGRGVDNFFDLKILQFPTLEALRFCFAELTSELDRFRLRTFPDMSNADVVDLLDAAKTLLQYLQNRRFAVGSMHDVYKTCSDRAIAGGYQHAKNVLPPTEDGQTDEVTEPHDSLGNY